MDPCTCVVLCLLMVLVADVLKYLIDHDYPEPPKETK